MAREALVLVLETGLGEARELVAGLNRDRLVRGLIASEDALRPLMTQRHRWPTLLGEARAVHDFLRGTPDGMKDPPDLMLVVDAATQAWALEAFGYLRPYWLWRDEGPAALAPRAAEYLRRAKARRSEQAIPIAATVCRRLADDPDYAALVHLYCADSKTASLTRLSLDSGINLSTLRRIVDRLEARGLLHVEQGINGDGRVREVFLTPAGSSAVESDIAAS